MLREYVFFSEERVKLNKFVKSKKRLIGAAEIIIS